MPLPERVLIEDSAFIALLESTDPNHAVAVRTYQRLLDREQELWMTSLTAIRTAGAVQLHFGRDGLRVFNESIEGIIHVFWVDPATYQKALATIADRQVGDNLTVEDSLTLTVAKLLRAYVFTFNAHFARLGIATVPRIQAARK